MAWDRNRQVPSGSASEVTGLSGKTLGKVLDFDFDFIHTMSIVVVS